MVSLLYIANGAHGSIVPMKHKETLHPITELLLKNRGIEDPQAQERFLNPDYERDSYDPFLILNMERAVDRIFTAIRGSERIVIYGDYDCDGIPGSVILHDLFEKIGVTKFSNYIPHRHHEGYGLNKEAIAKFAKEKVDLIITVDCGISDFAEVEMAQSLGIDVIVTDHHLPPANLPPAYAVLNSKQEGDTYPDNMLCGAGVAFKLAQAILMRGKKERKFGDIPSGWEKWLLDMAGLSTIADMVPLQNENRMLAYYGLKVLRKSPRPGLLALLKEAGTDQRYLTEEDVGFTIGPRINAASRMDVPLRAFELLSTRDVSTANSLAAHLAALNVERKSEVARMVKEAVHLVGKRELREVIVVGNVKWRVGVAGIVANKLAETYDRPAFVWGKEGSQVIKGSCRSDGRVSVFDLMMAVREGVLIDRGGHEFSGGFSISDESIHFLESALVDAHAKVEKKEKSTANSDIDSVLDIEDVNREVFQAIDRLAPFGVGNPRPLFKFENVEISKVEQFGKGREHMKLIFHNSETGDAVTAMGFFMNPNTFKHADIQNGARITLAATFEQSHFRGRSELRLRIVNIS